MKKIFPSLAIIAAVALGTVTLSSAFFSDTESSQNNILAAGSIDLKIDNTSYYNGEESPDTTWELSDLTDHLFLNFLDLKPSDWGEDTISIHVEDNESWACVDVTLTQNDDNTCNEAELEDDPTCAEPNAEAFDGELAQLVEFIFWIDDGDNVLEDNEFENNVLAQGSAEEVLTNSWALADSQNNLIGGSVGEGLDPEQTYYIGKAWCFGDLAAEPITQDGQTDAISPATTTGGISCDGSSLNNASQTDNLLADFEFRAEQHRNNPDFLCNPDDGPCENEIYGGTYIVEGSTQGKKKNGTNVDAARSNPDNMLGTPDGDGNANTGFYSLGFGGVAILKFSEPVFDGPDNDLIFHEITNNRQSYPEETVKVEVSFDGVVYYDIGTASSQDPAGVASLDIGLSPLSSILYVKLTDTSNTALHSSTADGYDVDAIEGIWGACQL